MSRSAKQKSARTVAETKKKSHKITCQRRSCRRIKNVTAWLPNAHVNSHALKSVGESPIQSKQKTATKTLKAHQNACYQGKYAACGSCKSKQWWCSCGFSKRGMAREILVACVVVEIPNRTDKILLNHIRTLGVWGAVQQSSRRMIQRGNRAKRNGTMKCQK